MRADLLHIVTCVSNPLLWSSRIRHARKSITDWIASGAKVYLIECVNGERNYELDDIPGLVHIPVRSYGLAWNKENLLNIALGRLPHDAKYIMMADADIYFRRKDFAEQIVHALQMYPVVQPWHTALDLGPNDEVIQTHRSFCSLYHEGKPVVATTPKFWEFDGGPYKYSHTGFAWAYTRRFLEEVGGLIEICGMGSADHHMACGLISQIEKSLPGECNTNYVNALKRWEARAVRAANYNIGFVPLSIEHYFHGRKQDRAYVSRWQMFLDHDFDPDNDLKKNSYGVIEFSGNKPTLTRMWDNYMRARREDVGSL